MAPWVVVASLPFAPEIVIPTVRHLAGLKLGGQDRPYGFKRVVQPDLPRRRQPDRLVGDAVLIRHRPGASGADDRELPHRPDLGHHAPLPVFRRRAAAGRVHRRLALARQPPMTPHASPRPQARIEIRNYQEPNNVTWSPLRKSGRKANINLGV